MHNKIVGAMLYEELRVPVQHRVFSTTLPYGGREREKDVLIEPWSNEGVQVGKGKEVKRLRVHTVERGWSKEGRADRKRSVDERIVQMYRKYGGEGSVLGEGEPKSGNSREVYRQKLREFQKGSQFRQLGQRKGESQQNSAELQPLEMMSLRLANVYCCDYKGPGTEEQSPKKVKGEYKYNDKFQRMLKIRDKIRRKNSLAVSKQREKFQNQYEAGGWTAIEREPGFAKATLQRNRLKLRMRGLSKEQLRQKGGKGEEVKGQCYRMQMVGVYSGAFQQAVREVESGRARLNRTQGYFSH